MGSYRKPGLASPTRSNLESTPDVPPKRDEEQLKKPVAFAHAMDRSAGRFVTGVRLDAQLSGERENDKRQERSLF